MPRMDSLQMVLAVFAAQRNATRTGPFPAATNRVYGTAFAISSSLFLTAAHVAKSASVDGEVALGKLGGPASASIFEPVLEIELFEDVDIALLRCEGLDPFIYAPDFEPMAIFEEVRAVGFGLGLDPEYLTYAPRGFAGHVVAGRQMWRWPQQPLVYEVSFVPPKGMSGAPLVAQHRGELRFNGIIVGSEQVELEGDVTRLGIVVSSEELLRLRSDLTGGALATIFHAEALPRRSRIGTTRERQASEPATE